MWIKKERFDRRADETDAERDKRRFTVTLVANTDNDVQWPKRKDAELVRLSDAPIAAMGSMYVGGFLEATLLVPKNVN